MKIICVLLIVLFTYVRAQYVCGTESETLALQHNWVYPPTFACGNICPCLNCWIDFQQTSKGLTTGTVLVRAGSPTIDWFLPISYNWSGDLGTWTTQNATFTVPFGTYNVQLTVTDGIHSAGHCSATLVNNNGVLTSCPSGTLNLLPGACGCYEDTSMIGKSCLTTDGMDFKVGNFTCNNYQIYCV